MTLQGVSAVQLAIDAGIARKTINNVLTGRFGASSDVIESLAKALKTKPFLLLCPRTEVLSEQEPFLALIHSYSNASKEGRSSILMVAKMAAEASSKT